MKDRFEFREPWPGSEQSADIFCVARESWERPDDDEGFNKIDNGCVWI